MSDRLTFVITRHNPKGTRVLSIDIVKGSERMADVLANLQDKEPHTRSTFSVWCEENDTEYCYKERVNHLGRAISRVSMLANEVKA